MKLGNETDNQTDPNCLHSAELEKLGNEQPSIQPDPHTPLCWMCDAYGKVMRALPDLDCCQECLDQIVESATCHACGNSIPEQEAVRAVFDALQTHNLDIICLDCKPVNDGIPYWEVKK